MIKTEDIRLVEYALETALRAGADKARATFSRSGEDLVATLNGEIDKVTHCADSSLCMALFVDGRFGTFSTDKLDREALCRFIGESADIVRMLAPDACRDLPDPARCCRDAVSGNELGLLGGRRESVTPRMRNEIALKAGIFRGGTPAGARYRMVSEEGEYSDSVYDTVLADTNGVLCCHSEECFDYGVEVTIESEGNRYSGYWWDSSPDPDRLDPGQCGTKALERACGQIGSAPAESGRYNMVVDTEVASRLVSPLLRALNASALQQNNSFLMDSLGKRLFSERLDIVDRPRIPGQTCSKYFDSEGVATADSTIIGGGTVREYFVNTYMSGKMGIAPTVESATRPVLLPTDRGTGRDFLLGKCSDGILVTDFNGGNSNPVTGDFSYGIEGYLFSGGKITRPVSGMLVTGNFISLWKDFIASADDARSCMSKLIPTLAFSNVDFSG